MERDVFGVSVQLSGQDGNGFSLVSRCRVAARKAGIPSADIETFTAEATEGDYDHLLQTCMRYFEVS